MAEARQRPPDPLTAFPHGRMWSDPPLSRLPRVGVVLAAGRSQRLESVTGVAPRTRTAEPPLLSAHCSRRWLRTRAVE
jgi:hypothetical protein